MGKVKIIEKTNARQPRHVQEFVGIVADVIEMVMVSDELAIDVGLTGLALWQVTPRPGKADCLPVAGNSVGFRTIAKVLSDKHEGQEINFMIPFVDDPVEEHAPTIDHSKEWPLEKMKGIYQRIFDAVLIESPKIILSENGGSVALDVLYGESENLGSISYFQRRLKHMIENIALANGRRIYLSMRAASQLAIA